MLLNCFFVKIKDNIRLGDFLDWRKFQIYLAIFVMEEISNLLGDFFYGGNSKFIWRFFFMEEIPHISQLYSHIFHRLHIDI